MEVPQDPIEQAFLDALGVMDDTYRSYASTVKMY